MSELEKWVPWAFSNLQPWKRLVLFATNVLVVVAVFQAIGVDFVAITHGNVVPPIPWWGTGALAALLVWVEFRLSNEQENDLRERVGASSPPAEPES